MAPTLDELKVGDRPEAWQACGFQVDGGTCVVGGIRIRLVAADAAKGLAFVAPDLDATVASLGDRVSEIRAAIQPGRRIATLRRSAGLALPIALITPPLSTQRSAGAGARR